MNDSNRDRALERLLRQPAIHGRPGPGDDCLDAETLASWMDGGLDSSAAASAEAHMSTCARCQALVATMARVESADLIEDSSSIAAEAPWWRANIRWLVPITAGVTAGLLWTVIPDQQRTTPVAEQQFGPAIAEVAPPPPPAPEPSSPSPKASAPQAATPLPQAAPARERQDRPPGVRPNEQAKADPPPAADAAPAPTAKAARPPVPPPAFPAAPEAAAAAPEAAGRRAEAPLFSTRSPLEVPSPDAAVRWRVGASAIERTADNGLTWTASALTPPADILAGSAPSTDVCWLAGRDGTVLLTTDGSTWRHVTAPTPDDLVFIEATDHAHAVVRSAGGRTFRTFDGGATWSTEP